MKDSLKTGYPRLLAGGSRENKILWESPELPLWKYAASDIMGRVPHPTEPRWLGHLFVATSEPIDNTVRYRLWYTDLNKKGGGRLIDPPTDKHRPGEWFSLVELMTAAEDFLRKEFPE